jgi:hypothetical protein
LIKGVYKKGLEIVTRTPKAFHYRDDRAKITPIKGHARFGCQEKRGRNEELYVCGVWLRV